MWLGGIPVDPRVPVGSTWDQFHALCRSKWLKMTENEAKMSQNDQNAFKMRVKTCHGHKRGALGVTYFFFESHNRTKLFRFF